MTGGWGMLTALWVIAHGGALQSPSVLFIPSLLRGSRSDAVCVRSFVGTKVLLSLRRRKKRKREKKKKKKKKNTTVRTHSAWPRCQQPPQRYRSTPYTTKSELENTSRFPLLAILKPHWSWGRGRGRLRSWMGQSRNILCIFVPSCQRCRCWLPRLSKRLKYGVD